MTGYEALSGLPVVATITTDSGSRALHMAESYETDTRDEGTYYVSTTSATDQSIVFVVVADLERGGVLLQAAKNRAGEGEGKTDYMYLAVHKAREEDELYPDFIRVIFHQDRDKAAVWVLADADGKKVLQVKKNLDESGGDSEGAYLAIPPDSDRDESSAYVAVTSDSGAATVVALKAEGGSAGGASGGYGGSSYQAEETTGYGGGGYAGATEEGNEYETPSGEGGYGGGGEGGYGGSGEGGYGGGGEGGYGETGEGGYGGGGEGEYGSGGYNTGSYE